MACRMPGCGTKYCDKNNTNRLYRPLTDKQFKEWREILSCQGVNNFGRKNMICELHFTESDIERERIEYGPGGQCYSVPLKKSGLCHNAVPTIFSPKIPQKQKLDYAVKLDFAVIKKEPEMFQAIAAVKSAAKKRKVSNENVEDKTIATKILNGNDVFKAVLYAVENKIKLFDISNNWITNISSRKCVIWSKWKIDCTSQDKVVILQEDLTLKVFIEAQQIILENFQVISDIQDLCKLFAEVARMIPCQKADYETKEAGKACLGFVIPKLGRPKLRCAVCQKYQTNLRRRMLPKLLIAFNPHRKDLALVKKVRLSC